MVTPVFRSITRGAEILFLPCGRIFASRFPVVRVGSVNRYQESLPKSGCCESAALRELCQRSCRERPRTRLHQHCGSHLRGRGAAARNGCAGGVRARHDQVPGANWGATGSMLGIGIPVQVFVILLFFLMARAGLANSLLGLIIVYDVNRSLHDLLVARLFREPAEFLQRSGAIYGGTRFGMFRWAMLPFGGAGMITATIFNVVFLLNDFLLALMFMRATRSSCRR